MRLRLTLSFVAGAALLAVAGVAVTYTLLARQLHGDLDDELAQQLSLFGGAVVSAEDSDSLVGLTRAYLSGHGAENLRRRGIILAVETADGLVVSTAGEVALEALPESVALVSSGEPVLVTVPTGSGSYRLAGVPIQAAGGERIAAVVVGAPLGGLNETLRRVLVLLSLGASAGTLAMGYGAWLLVGRALAPVGRIARTASTISRDDLTERIDYKGPYGEIAELASTMDAMLDRLQQAFESQERFITDVSHELRTPLTVAKGYLQVLDREEAFDPDAVRQGHRVVVGELDRMNRLVGDLLTLTRSTRVDFLRREPVALDPLLRMLSDQGPHLAEREWRIESSPGGTAVVDQDRVIQVFLNLMHNAVAHTRTGDVIALGGEWTVGGGEASLEPGHPQRYPAGPRWVRLWVRDEGAGMTEDVRERLFERFYRGPAGRTPAPATARDPLRDEDAMGQHLGLGLAIAAALVRAHGGRIEVRSASGAGSTFSVHLPAGDR